METIIRVRAGELNLELLKKIKDFIGGKENVEVTISLTEFDPDYASELDRSMQEAQRNDVVTFTMEEFVAYRPEHK
jgi:hypothetical protein